MAQGCMSQGGIPVQPYFVLGGFTEDDYQGEPIQQNLQANVALVNTYFYYIIFYFLIRHKPSKQCTLCI
jgi:hypothetical protein